MISGAVITYQIQDLHYDLGTRSTPWRSIYTHNLYVTDTGGMCTIPTLSVARFLDINGKGITGMSAPLFDFHAANKKYVDDKDSATRTYVDGKDAAT
jgi:hypothetical protein